MAEEQLRAKLQAAFTETDVDKSGSISHAELKNALNKAGFEPTDDDVKVHILDFFQAIRKKRGDIRNISEYTKFGK